MAVITLKSAQHLFCSRSNWLISTTLNWLMAWKFSFRNSNSDIAFITVAGKNNKNVFWLNIYLANKQKWHKGLKFFLQENDQCQSEGQQGVKPYLFRNILGLNFFFYFFTFQNYLSLCLCGIAIFPLEMGQEVFQVCTHCLYTNLCNWQKSSRF